MPRFNHPLVPRPATIFTVLAFDASEGEANEYYPAESKSRLLAEEIPQPFRTRGGWKQLRVSEGVGKLYPPEEKAPRSIPGHVIDDRRR